MSLVNELLKGLLEQSKKTVAVYGGGFKPPTKGHFEVVKQALDENPEIDEFIIFVGKGERDGITQEDSIKIWGIYRNYLPFKVKVVASSKPPIQEVYNYAKNNPDDEVLWVIGAREENEADFADIASRTKSITKYPNLELRTIVTKGGISGTAARNASKVSPEKLNQFLPDFLSTQEKQSIFVVLNNEISENINEIGDLSQTPYKFTTLPSSKSSPYSYYKFTTDNGAIYEVVFEREETDVATTYSMAFTAKGKEGDSFSSSALTGGNEPLKIMSTVADITKKHIDKVDDADYLKFEPTKGKEGEEGNSNTRAKLYKLIVKKNFPNLEIIADDDTVLIDLEGYYDDITEADPKKGTGKKPKGSGRRLYTDEDPSDTVKVKFSTRQDVVDTLNKTSFKNKSHARQSQVINLIHQRVRAALSRTKDPAKKKKLKSAFEYIKKRKEASKAKTQRLKKQKLNEHASYTDNINIPKRIAEFTNHMLDKGMNIEPLPTLEFIDGDSENAKDFLGKTAYYDPDAKHIVLYTEGRHPKDIVRSYAHEMIHHIQNLEGRLGNITTTNTTEDDNLTKLEQEANLKGTMTFRGWTDSIKEGKKKDPFGLNAYAAELGRLREDEQDYKIYLDMDGVVADFEQRFRDLSGMGPRDFEAKYGKNAFWDFIDEGDNKIKFWVGIPPMEGASQLVNYVSKHDYVMLTAPSIKKQSRLGKALWVRNHTGDIFPSKPTVIFKSAKEKHKVKPSLTKKDILIDDKASTIDNWNAAGGTGILYTSASQVISELKKLGL
jgi:hypothetical protein